MFIWVILLKRELSEEFKAFSTPFCGWLSKIGNLPHEFLSIKLQVVEFIGFPSYGMQSALII